MLMVNCYWRDVVAADDDDDDDDGDRSYHVVLSHLVCRKNAPCSFQLLASCTGQSQVQFVSRRGSNAWLEVRTWGCGAYIHTS